MLRNTIAFMILVFYFSGLSFGQGFLSTIQREINSIEADNNMILSNKSFSGFFEMKGARE